MNGSLAMFRRRSTPSERMRSPQMARAAAWPKVVLSVLLILLGLGGVLLASFGSVRGVALVTGALASIGLLMLPLELLFGLMLLLTFVVVGAVAYFTKLEVVYWVPYGMALLLYFRFLITQLNRSAQDVRRPMSLVIGLLVAYLLLALASGLINQIEFGDWVLAVKHYLLLWSALLILHYSIRQEATFDWMWRVVLFVTVAQVPFVLYQYVVVGGRLASKGISGADAVSGTLGGSEHGGSSGALAFLAVVALLFALALYRVGRLKTRYVITVVAASLIVLAVAEVKAAVLVFLPIGMLFLYRRNIVRRPGAFVGGTAACLVVVFAIMAGYQKLHYSRVDKAATPLSVTERIERAFGSETQTSMVGLHMHDLGRTALLAFWFTEHKNASISEILIGHGPASTRTGKFAAGAVAQKYYMVGLVKTPVSILLWEVGVVGFLLAMSIPLAAAWMSSRLSGDDRVPPSHRAYLEAGAVVLLLLAVSLFYSRYAIETPSIQLLFMMCLGQVGYWQARVWRGQVTQAGDSPGSGHAHKRAPATRSVARVGGRSPLPAPHRQS